MGGTASDAAGVASSISRSATTSRHHQQDCRRGTGRERNVRGILLTPLEVRFAGGGVNINVLRQAQIAALFPLGQVDENDNNLASRSSVGRTQQAIVSYETAIELALPESEVTQKAQKRLQSLR